MRYKLAIALLMSLMVVSVAAADVLKIRPDGQGSRKQWTNINCPGGDDEWQCVDEEILNNTDRLEATDDNKKESFTFGDTGLTTETINYLKLVFDAKWIDSSNKCFTPVIVINSTGYQLWNDTICLTSTPDKYQVQVDNNPATGSAWTVGEVDDLVAGMTTGTTNSGGSVRRMFVNVNYDPLQTCGNDEIEGTETCDGTDLGGETCASQGFDGGTLSCNANCDGFVTTSCYDNTCSETDNGNDPWWPYGWTQGDFEGAAYNYTDVCLNTSHLQEYYCDGDVWASTVIRCDDLTINPTDCIPAARSCVEQG